MRNCKTYNERRKDNYVDVINDIGMLFVRI